MHFEHDATHRETGAGHVGEIDRLVARGTIVRPPLQEPGSIGRGEASDSCSKFSMLLRKSKISEVDRTGELVRWLMSVLGPGQVRDDEVGSAWVQRDNVWQYHAPCLRWPAAQQNPLL